MAAAGGHSLAVLLPNRGECFGEALEAVDALSGRDELDVLVGEMALWVNEISPMVEAESEPVARIETWVRGVLGYVKDGRHVLVKSAGSVELPEARRVQVTYMHRELVAPLVQALTELEVPDVRQYSAFCWGVLNSAITRVESQGFDTVAEGNAVMVFITSGVGK